MLGGHNFPLYPWPFNIFINQLVTEARKHFYGSLRLITGQLEVLLFADDVAMPAEAEKGLQHYLQEMNNTLKKWKMKANWQKTKAMRIRKNQDVQ